MFPLITFHFHKFHILLSAHLLEHILIMILAYQVVIKLIKPLCDTIASDLFFCDFVWLPCCSITHKYNHEKNA